MIIEFINRTKFRPKYYLYYMVEIWKYEKSRLLRQELFLYIYILVFLAH